MNKNGWLCSHTVEYYFPFVHSFCVRSTTWSKRAGHQTCDATRYHWIEMRKEMDPQPRGFVWMGSQPGRDDWEMCSMIALQEWTRTRSSLFQLTGLTSTPMEVKHTFTSWQILCQLKGLNFRCLALLFGIIFSDTISHVWRSVNKPLYPQHSNRRLVILGGCLMEVSFMILYEFKERQGCKVPSEFFLDKKRTETGL